MCEEMIGVGMQVATSQYSRLGDQTGEHLFHGIIYFFGGAEDYILLATLL